MMLFKGPEKRIAVHFCILEIFYFFCLVGRYSSSLNSPSFSMILGLFKYNIASFKGPKETRGVCSHVLETFYFFCFAK